MPQRQLWATAHATRLKLELHENPLRAEVDPTITYTVYDQGGKFMSRAATSLPTGFVPWALSDVALQTALAYCNHTPEVARRAFLATAASWRDDVRQLGLTQ